MTGKPWRKESRCLNGSMQPYQDDDLKESRALGYIKTEVAMGIPVKISGKSIYYDRPTPAKD
jgi:hypothetical protein